MNLISNNSPKLVFYFHLLFLILFVICLTDAYPVIQDTGEVYPEVETKLDIRDMFQEVNHHRKKVRSRGVPNVEHPGIDPEPLPSTDHTVLERNMDSLAQEKHSKFGWMSKRSFYTIGGYGLLTIILCVVGFLLVRYSRKGTNSSDTAEQSKTSGKDLKDPNHSDSEGSESGGRHRKGRKGGYKKAEQINQQNRRLRDKDPRDRRSTKNKDTRNGQSSDSEAPLSSSSSSSSSSVERNLTTKSNNKRNKRQKKNKPHNRGPKDLAGLASLTGSSSLDEEPCSMRNRERRKNRNKHFKDYQKYATEPRQPQPTSILSRSETETGQSLLRSSSSSSNDGSQMLKANQRPSESGKKLPNKDQGKAIVKPPTLTTLTTTTNPYDLSSTQQSSWLESSEPESKSNRTTKPDENPKNLTYGANSVFNLDKKGNLVVKNMRLNRNQQLHTELVNRQANRAQATNKSSRFSGSLTRTSSSELLSSQQHQSVGSNTTSTSSPNSVNLSKILLHNPALVKHNKAVKNGPKVMVPAVPNCLDTDLVKSSLINEMSSSVLFESETCRSLNRTVSSIDFDTRTNQVSTHQQKQPQNPQQKNAEPSRDSRRNLLNEILCYQSRTAKKRKANRPLFTQNESNTESAVIYDVVQKQGQIAAAAASARTITAQTGPEAVPIAPKQVKNCTGETMINANFVRDNKRKVRSARRKKILKSILRNSKSSIDAWSLMDEDDADGDNDKDEDNDDLDQDSDLRDDSEQLGSKNNDSSDRPNSRKQVSFSRDICSVRYIK